MNLDQLAHTIVRTTDPDTSKAAAKKAAPRAPIVREAVRTVLLEDGEGTLDQIVARFNRRAGAADWPTASASSIRTRVSELVRDGLAEAVPDGEGRSALGNRARIWRAVTVQSSETLVS